MIGIAYKKNVDDMRESPAFRLIELLWRSAAPPSTSTTPTCGRFRRPASMRNSPGGRRSPGTAKAIGGYDAVLIATDHDNIDYRALVEHASLVIDTRNACARAGMTSPKIVKA